MGLVLLVISLPLAACITEAPEQRGLTMDGDPPGSVPHPPHPSGARRPRWAPPVWRPPEEYSVRQALRSWAFWNLTGGTVLRLLAKTGATVHIIPILASKGVSEQTAAFLLGTQLLLTVPLYLLLGWAADRFPKPPCSWGPPWRGRPPSPCWPPPGTGAACSWPTWSCSRCAMPVPRLIGRWSASILGARRSVACGAIFSSPPSPGHWAPQCGWGGGMISTTAIRSPCGSTPGCRWWAC